MALCNVRGGMGQMGQMMGWSAPNGPFWTFPMAGGKYLFFTPRYRIRIFWGRWLLPQMICPLPRAYGIRL